MCGGVWRSGEVCGCGKVCVCGKDVWRCVETWEGVCGGVGRSGETEHTHQDIVEEEKLSAL